MLMTYLPLPCAITAPTHRPPSITCPTTPLHPRIEVFESRSSGGSTSLPTLPKSCVHQRRVSAPTRGSRTVSQGHNVRRSFLHRKSLDSQLQTVTQVQEGALADQQKTVLDREILSVESRIATLKRLKTWHKGQIAALRGSIRSWAG